MLPHVHRPNCTYIYIFAHKIHVCQSRRPEVLAYIFDILIVVSHCCPKQQFTSKPKKFWQPSGHRNAVGVYLQIHLHINLFIASSFHEIILQNVACWSHFSPYSNSSIFRLISPIAHNFLAEIQNELYFSFEFPFFFSLLWFRMIFRVPNYFQCSHRTLKNTLSTIITIFINFSCRRRKIRIGSKSYRYSYFFFLKIFWLLYPCSCFVYLKRTEPIKLT